ncbi:PREDICTED: uncharacterized protein LOC109221026 [Nicotiana attenuata]|uniref:uncharacterized protein LOC109220920 n=1 Tax=Nicotiana attenuata TaxID=49451 RepID=UPI000904D5FC|nr:PREDICTED: uncharacterized protein LOC109220920 [Nicotiana attenuata]XP_019241034.1 PREDICTED: uncharacterized protein LOC109221026 [Nicotiana attenuata]
MESPKAVNPANRRAEPQAWANLFQQNRATTHGMTLRYIPPQIVDGQLVRYIAQHWIDIAETDLFLHDEGYYVIKFQSLVDMHKVFYPGPHTTRNRPIILKPWTPEFDLSKELLTDIPLWVIFPKLPMSCWGSKALSKIAGAIGKPLFADECTTKQTRISYARMLIEVNVTKTLPAEITVLNPRGRKFQQELVYERKPNYCDKCQTIGHVCHNQQGPREQ